MAWKGLHITQPARLSLADGQCWVKQEDKEVRVSIEDLAWIVVDTPQATLTSALISACMEAGVAMVVTDFPAYAVRSCAAISPAPSAGRRGSLADRGEGVAQEAHVADHRSA